MNWWVNPLKPMAMLSVLLGFAACETLTEIESPIGPDTNLVGVNYVELSLPTQLVQFDEVITSNTGRLLVGRYHDAELGTVEATSYIRMALSTPDPVIKSDSQVDSLVMMWQASYYAANRDVIPDQTFSVSFMQDGSEIIDSLSYYNTSSFPKGDFLGSGTFTLDRTQEDSVYKFVLDRAWGEDLLARMKTRDPAFKNSFEFSRVYPGLVIESDPANEAILGIRNTIETESAIALYFSSPGDTVSKRYDVLISGNNSKGFHSVTSERNGLYTSAMSGFFDPVDAGDRILGMAGAGYAPLLNLDSYRNYFDTIPPNLINYADLILADVEGVEVGKAPESIRFYLTTENGEFVPSIEDDVNQTVRPANPAKGIYSFGAPLNPQNFLQVSYFQPVLNDTAQSYSGAITSFLQAVADSTIVEPKLLIRPVAVGASVNTLKLDEADFRLRVYYTSPTN